MKKVHSISVLVIITSLVTIFAITYANDHKECDTKTEITFDNDGNRIVSEIHMCKEKFNF